MYIVEGNEKLLEILNRLKENGELEESDDIEIEYKEDAEIRNKYINILNIVNGEE